MYAAHSARAGPAPRRPRQRGELLVGDAALRADDQHDLASLVAAPLLDSGGERHLVQHIRRRPTRSGGQRLVDTAAGPTTGSQARRACFAASRAVAAHRSRACSPRSPRQTTHRSAAPTARSRRRRPRSSPARPVRPARPWRCPARRSGAASAAARTGDRRWPASGCPCRRRSTTRGTPCRPRRRRAAGARRRAGAARRRRDAPPGRRARSRRRSAARRPGTAARLTSAYVAVERVAHPGEEAALLGQLGDLLAPSAGELAHEALLLGVELGRRTHVEVHEQVAATGAAQVRHAAGPQPHGGAGLGARGRRRRPPRCPAS